MRDRDALKRTLSDIDRKGYGAYKQIRGGYDFDRFRLEIDHVQVDPFAPPSKVRVVLDRRVAALPEDLTDDADGRIAVSDYLTRRFAEAIGRIASGGGREDLHIGTPGQEVLERTSVLIADDRVEARFEVSLPTSGRRAVDGRAAARLFTQHVPEIAEASLLHTSLDAQSLRNHVVQHRDQRHLQAQLAAHGLIAFVGDGAILPRRSGDSDLPLEEGAVPFTGPDSLQVTMTLPSGRTVTGMGVPEGVSVIVGGGYHGKSTLLRAIERGVYPHIAGDGRERVMTRPDAVSVRAEDGRSVTGVDISPFISNLPSGTDTRGFTTTNASGSTSQAANLVEAVEAGSTALLIDEDTSATNFMIRDERMRELIAADREPITPFIDRIRPLYTDAGVSTVLVAGGSGAFFDVADHVIALDAYRPTDVTAEAHRIAEQSPEPGAVRGSDRQATETAGALFASSAAHRVPTSRGLSRKPKPKPAKARGRAVIHVGDHTIDLSAVAQLVDSAQNQALARSLDRLAEATDAETSVSALVDELCDRIDAEGLDWLSPFAGHPGHLARPRRHEIHAALNRCRTLQLDTGL